MTRRTIEELIAQADASLPDNSVREIAPVDVRTMVKDFLDTMTPMYGGLRGGVQTVHLTGVPTVLPFVDQLVSFPPEWSVNIAAGTLARKLAGVGASVTQFTINGDVNGSTNGSITVELYKNGQPTGWRKQVSTRGIDNWLSFAFAAYDFATVDATYDLRLSANFESDYTFANHQFIGMNLPVRTVNVAAGMFSPR